MKRTITVLRHNLPEEYWIFACLWWIIILPKPIQLAIFLMILVCLLRKNGFQVIKNRISLLMVFLFFIHIIAIIRTVIVANGIPDRIAAAINTALIWPVAAVFYSVYTNCKKLDLDLVGKLCCVNIGVLFIGTLVTLYAYYVKNIQGMDLFGKVLFTTTFLDGRIEPKFFGLHDFSNMNLLYIMLMVSLSMGYIRKQKTGMQLLFLLVCSLEVALIHSRTGMVLFTASIFFSYLELVPDKYKNLLYISLALGGTILIIVGYQKIQSIIINKIIYGNVSSTDTRVLLLSTSIREAWEQSPLIGMGIKRYFHYGYPLGSHSTFVGFFYKTGILGLIAGCSIFLASNIRWLRMLRGNQVLKTVWVFLLCFVALFFLEDVDGTNWSAFIYFSTLAIFSNTDIIGDCNKCKGRPIRQSLTAK